MDFAASNERFSASAEPMSGFGAPTRTVTATAVPATFAMPAAANLSCFCSSSITGRDRMTTSAVSPARIRFLISAIRL